MTENVEVKTRVIVEEDAGSKSVVQGLKNSFKQLHEVREQTQQGMGWFGHMVSNLAANEIPSMIHKMREFAQSFLEVSIEKDSAAQSLGGMITVLQDIPWKEAREEAEEYSDTLEDVAQETGQRIADIRAAAGLVQELGGAHSKAELAEQTEEITKLATIANVLGFSTQGITAEYQFMGEGILRTRGKLFQLLQTTGIFGDNTKKAAAVWAKLTDEQRQERLAQGLDKVSAKMAKAAPNFEDLTNQVANAMEMIKGDIGDPIRQALAPELKSLIGWLGREREEIFQFADGMKGKVAAAFHTVSLELQDTWRWVRSHEEELGKGIKEAWAYAKSVVEFIVQHKNAIAALAIARSVGGNDFVKGGAQAAYGVGKAVYASGSAAAMAASPAAGAIGGVAGGIASLGAFAVAIASVGLAADQARRLIQENNDTVAEDTRARYAMLKEMADEADKDFSVWTGEMQEHFGRASSAFVAMSAEVGLSTKVAQDMVDGIRKQHDANRALVDSAEYAAGAITRLAANGDLNTGVQKELVGSIVNQYKAAMDTQNQGALAYIANLFTQSKALQDAFVKSADLTSEGYSTLAELTKASASEFSDVLKGLADTAHKKESLAAKVPQVQFNGGQTFKIQQDFRDENPDRIAYVFQRDILAQAERRLQSSYASPFGS